MNFEKGRSKKTLKMFEPSFEMHWDPIGIGWMCGRVEVLRLTAKGRSEIDGVGGLTVFIWFLRL
jgi:hypothetical protein